MACFWRLTPELVRLEIQQRREEGCSVVGFEDKLKQAGEDKAKLMDLWRELRGLMVQADFNYIEPNDLKGIRAQRLQGPRKLKVSLTEEQLFDKIYGAWLGRCIGCNLGKPCEGWSREDIVGYLKNADAWPLADYFPPRSEDSEGNLRDLSRHPSVLNNIKYAAADDDTNYTVLALKLIEDRGYGFTTKDVGDFWHRLLPLAYACTAERQAYINYANELPLEEIPYYLNPYREWIGAQIRADLFGYITPGNPEHGAELAFKDASFSHVKNGIYGEMWVAAMLSVVAVTDDIEQIIRIGLSEIPAKSRLSEAISDCIRWHQEIPDWEKAYAQMMAKYGHYHPVHTINNACIVAMALLYGAGDFGKSIALSVVAGLDTDCNGATTGSILGAILGAEKIPAKWKNPINDALQTNLSQHPMLNIGELAARTVHIIRE